MPMLTHLDWRGLFIPTVSVAELMLRGSLMYLFLLGCLRMLRHEDGRDRHHGLAVVVLIADAAQNAMGRDYTAPSPTASSWWR